MTVYEKLAAKVKGVKIGMNKVEANELILNHIEILEKKLNIATEELQRLEVFFRNKGYVINHPQNALENINAVGQPND